MLLSNLSKTRCRSRSRRGRRALLVINDAENLTLFLLLRIHRSQSRRHDSWGLLTKSTRPIGRASPRPRARLGRAFDFHIFTRIRIVGIAMLQEHCASMRQCACLCALVSRERAIEFEGRAQTLLTDRGRSLQTFPPIEQGKRGPAGKAAKRRGDAHATKEAKGERVLCIRAHVSLISGRWKKKSKRNY
jgi:hypothetical protein